MHTLSNNKRKQITNDRHLVIGWMTIICVLLVILEAACS